VAHDSFPSGPWTGFYNYSPQDKHRMDLDLTFGGGKMTGGGNDDVGQFLIKGQYDAQSLECWWTKSYVGAHDVFYRGFRDGKGIWGTWEISLHAHGGFHIWPKAAGEGETEVESSEQPEHVSTTDVEGASPTLTTQPKSANGSETLPHPGPLPLGEGGATADNWSYGFRSWQDTFLDKPNRRMLFPLPAGEGQGEGESLAVRIRGALHTNSLVCFLRASPGCDPLRPARLILEKSQLPI